MFCKQCGSNMPDGTKFCPSCGTPTDADAAPQQSAAQPVPQQTAQPAAPAYRPPAAPGKPLPIAKLAISALVAILVLVVLVNLLTPPAFMEAKGAVYAEEINGEILIYTAKGSKERVDGSLRRTYISLDGTKIALLAGDSGTDVLYHIDSKLTKVSDEVYSFVISTSGDAIAYTKNYESGSADLYLYKGGKSERVASNVLAGMSICISPDGKSVGYVKEKNDDYYGYFWDGKENELGKNKIPKFLSNGAKQLYYDKSGTLYVQKGSNENSSTSLGSSWDDVFFNKDMTQIVYSSNNRAYISRKGSDKSSVSSTEISSFITPMGAAAAMQNGAVIYGFGNFANKLFVNDNDSICRMTKKYEAETVVRSYSGFQLCKDGKNLIYQRNNSIYKINAMKTNAIETELVTDIRVSYFMAVDGGKSLYFYSRDGEMYYQKGSGKPVMVTDDVQYSYSVAVFAKGNKLLYISDEELYLSTGKRGTMVKGLAGKVYDVSSDLFAVTITCYDDGEYTYYRSKDGKKFEKIAVFS